MVGVRRLTTKQHPKATNPQMNSRLAVRVSYLRVRQVVYKSCNTLENLLDRANRVSKEDLSNSPMNYNLALPFYENSITDSRSGWPVVGNARHYSYGDMASLARRISGWLSLDRLPVSGRVGILASRTVEAYAGVLGILWAGAAYVPINPQTPEDRLVRLLQMTNLDALIVDQAGLDLLSDRVLECAPHWILFGPNAQPPPNALRFQGIRFQSIAELSDEGPNQPVIVAGDALAYIIFTSGTTGTPKGVMIENESVAQFIEIMHQRFDLRADDRVAEAPELTFDASVFDMFMAWSSGAALYVVPKEQLMAPAKFIRDHELTLWFRYPLPHLSWRG